MNIPVTTITIGAYDKMHDLLTAICTTEDFKTHFPGVDVKIEYLSQYTTEWLLDDQAKHVYDVAMLNQMFFLCLSAQRSESGEEIFTDLARPPYNGLELREKLVPAAFTSVVTLDGRMLGLPLDLYPVVLHYRQSVMKELGIDLPGEVTSLSELAEVLSRLVDLYGKWSQVSQVMKIRPLTLFKICLNSLAPPWQWQADPAWQLTRLQPILECILEFNAQGLLALTAADSSNREIPFLITDYEVNNPQYASGVGANHLQPEAGGDWRAWYVPGLEQPHSYFLTASSFLIIPACTPEDRKGTCWEIMQYLTTTAPAQRRLFEEMQTLPVMQDLYSTDLFDQPVPYFGGQPVYRIYRDTVLHTQPSYMDQDNAVLFLFNYDILNPLVAGTIGLDEALQRCAAFLQRTAE